jgi:hypothetical protein
MRDPPVSHRFLHRARRSACRLHVAATRPRSRARRTIKALSGRAKSAFQPPPPHPDSPCHSRQRCPDSPAARLASRAAPIARVQSCRSASDRACLSAPRRHRPRRCPGKPLCCRVLHRVGHRSPLSSVLCAGREPPHRRQPRAVYPIRASTPFNTTPVSTTAAHRLSV